MSDSKEKIKKIADSIVKNHEQLGFFINTIIKYILEKDDSFSSWRSKKEKMFHEDVRNQLLFFIEDRIKSNPQIVKDYFNHLIEEKSHPPDFYFSYILFYMSKNNLIKSKINFESINGYKDYDYFKKMDINKAKFETLKSELNEFRWNYESEFPIQEEQLFLACLIHLYNKVKI